MAFRILLINALLALFLVCQPVCKAQGCGTLPGDIQFLLDTSGSIGDSNFNKVKEFVKRFAYSFTIGPNTVNIGVATFDKHPRNEFWLNQHKIKNSLLKAIDRIGYPAGSTHTGKALQFVRQHAFTKAHGDRDRVANILIVVTDGKSDDKQNTLKQAAELHKTNVNVFAVGVGGKLDRSELDAIASKPQNIFTVNNFNLLDSIRSILTKTACKVDGNWGPWGSYSSCTKSCGGGTQYRGRTCNDPAPANGGKNCQGNGRENRNCNTEACPTTPPPTTFPKPGTCNICNILEEFPMQLEAVNQKVESCLKQVDDLKQSKQATDRKLKSLTRQINGLKQSKRATDQKVKSLQKQNDDLKRSKQALSKKLEAQELSFKRLQAGCCVTNVAYKKTATQSSTHETGYARKAVDGDLSTTYSDGTCTQTTDSRGQWWQVDLGAQFAISSVTLTNRGDCCANKLSNFKIFVYNDNPTTNQRARSTLCLDHRGPMAAGVTQELKCTRTISGRYVRITKDGVLTLCEVQVMVSRF